MTQHIIDTDELEKLQQYVMIDMTNGVEQCKHGDYVHIDDLRALIANSPQADGMVLVPSEYRLDYSTGTPILMHKDCSVIEGKEAVAIFEMLSAYKPQADDVPLQQQPTSNDVKSALLFCLYHHQGSGSLIGQPIRKALGIGQYDPLSKEQCNEARRVQSLLSEADDVRKDAERFRSIAENKFGVHFENNTVLGEIVEVYSKHDEDGNCQCDTERTANTPIDALRLAIDKARE